MVLLVSTGLICVSVESCHAHWGEGVKLPSLRVVQHCTVLVSCNDMAVQIQGVEKQTPLDGRSCEVTLQRCSHIGMGIIVNN